MKTCPFKAGRLRDLQSTYHQHSSVTRPLGRFVSLFDAMLSTAQTAPNVLCSQTFQSEIKVKDQLSFRIFARKTQKKTLDMVGAFLAEFTTEEVLQLAMMADASDEELTLIRKFDQEFLCAGSLKSRVELFADRVDYLYTPVQAPSNLASQSMSFGELSTVII